MSVGRIESAVEGVIIERAHACAIARLSIWTGNPLQNKQTRRDSDTDLEDPTRAAYMSDDL
jgi:hypothetical protein